MDGFLLGQKSGGFEIDEEEFKCFEKAFNDFKFDIALVSFMTHDVKIIQSLGGRQFFYSSDGITIQYRTGECSYMQEDEYPQFIADPLKYTKNVDFPRRFPELSKPYPQNYEALKKALGYYLAYIQKAAASAPYYREHCGVPCIVGGTVTASVDYLHDFYRGMKDIMIDIRRRPQQVKDAAAALVPIIKGLIPRGADRLEPFPYTFFPLHIPTYLNKRQFESIYWPTLKELFDYIYGMGGKVLIALESHMEHEFDFINELPKNFAICIIDDMDMNECKKAIGDTVAICGGIPSEMLKYKSKEECIDYVKDIIDTCAPGGGFAPLTTRVLLAPNDVKIENLTAVNEFILGYGR